MAQISVKVVEEGEKVKRIVELAKERNIDFKPSSEARHNLQDYCDRKGITNPLTGTQGQAVNVSNVYNPPLPPPPSFNGGGLPPANFPPNGGIGGGMGGGYGQPFVPPVLPIYDPQS